MLNAVVLSSGSQDVTGTFSDVITVLHPGDGETTLPFGDELSVIETMEATYKLGRILDVLSIIEAYTNSGVDAGTARQHTDIVGIVESFGVSVHGDWTLTPDQLVVSEYYIAYVEQSARTYSPMQ